MKTKVQSSVLDKLNSGIEALDSQATTLAGAVDKLERVNLELDEWEKEVVRTILGVKSWDEALDLLRWT